MGYFRPLSQSKFINDANLVSYWTLDGNSNDSKGSNNGTDTSISYSTGNAVNSNFGQGASLNGTTSNISTPDSALGIGSAFTFSFWIKTSAITEQGIYCRDTVGVLRAWQFRIDATTGVLRLVRFDSGGGLQTNFATSTAVNTGNYTHVVATWNTTIGTVLYINGKNSGTDSNVTAQNNNTGVTPKIGIGTGAAAIGPFNGTIDDGAVFSRALSAGEVAELYQSQTLGEYLGAGSGTTKLLLHLNGSSADSSGNSKNGTNTSVTFSQANGKFGQGAGASAGSIIGAAPLTYSEITSAYTISLWFKMNTFVNNGFFFGVSASNGSRRSFVYFRCIIRGTNNWEIAGTLSVGGSYITLKTGITSDTSWHNLIITYNGSNIIMDLDGGTTIVNTVCTMTNDAGTDNAYGVLSGWDGGGNGTCSVDEVIIENVAWSAEKRKKEYTKQKGRFGII